MTTRLRNRRSTADKSGTNGGGILASLDNIHSIRQRHLTRRKQKQPSAAESDWSDAGGETSPEKQGTETKTASSYRRVLPPTKQSLGQEKVLPSCVIVFPTEEQQEFPELKLKSGSKGQKIRERREDDEMSALSFWSTDADAAENLNPRRKAVRMRKKRQTNIQSKQQHGVKQSPHMHDGKNTLLMTKVQTDNVMQSSIRPKKYPIESVAQRRLDIDTDSQFLTIANKSKNSGKFAEEEENDESTTSSTTTKTSNKDDEEGENLRSIEKENDLHVNTKDIGISDSDNNIVSEEDSYESYCEEREEEAEASFYDLDESDCDEINGEDHYSDDEDYVPGSDDDTDSSDDELESLVEEERVVRKQDHQQQRNTIVCNSAEKAAKRSSERDFNTRRDSSGHTCEVEGMITDAEFGEQIHTMTEGNDSAEDDDETIEATIIEDGSDDDDLSTDQIDNPRKNEQSNIDTSSVNVLREEQIVSTDDIDASNHSKKKMSFVKRKKSQDMVKRNTAYERRSVKTGKWKLGSKIGVGSFGVVHVGMNMESGTLMAVKSVQMDQVMMKDIRREIELLKSLEHVNIVQYYGAEVNKMVLHIFQEWVSGGSITGMLKKFGSFSMPVIKTYLRQILSGLAYLHDNKIVHRDIKGSNVLVNDHGIVKLADFGASRKIAQCQGEMLLTMTLRGTPYFMAPEVFEEKYSFKADVWSVGCVAFQMLTSKAPWKEAGFNNPVSLFNHIKSHNRIPSMDSWAGRTEFETKRTECTLFKSLLSKCFNRDPRLRPTTSELLNESFFIEIGDFLEDEITGRRSGLSPCNNSVYSWEIFKSPMTPKPVNNIVAEKTTTPNRVLPRSGSVGHLNSDPPLFSPPVPKRIEEPLVSSKQQAYCSAFSSPLSQSSPEIDSSGWPTWARERHQQGICSNRDQSFSLARGVLRDSRLDDVSIDLRNQSCSLARGVLMGSLEVTGGSSEHHRAIVVASATSDNGNNNPFSSSHCSDSSSRRSPSPLNGLRYLDISRGS